MTSELRTLSGIVSLVDDDVYEWASQMRWHLHKGKKNPSGYFGTNVRVGDRWRYRLLHRLITDAPPGLLVDHINRDTLDNRRTNLRIATYSENAHNSGKHISKSSRYKGVCWNKSTNSWMARIGVNWQNIYLGTFPTEELAARAYDAAAIEIHGAFASPNEVEKV